jgi:pimeloyl-ACP methyl ester carboxylesterase
MIYQTFTSQDITLAYREWGQGDNIILLLHGLADHGGVWSSLGEFLSTDYHIIAPDLRGHGNSSKPATGYLFKDYIQDLNVFIDTFPHNKLIVLGHSWGAKLAAFWVTNYTQKFKQLILVDPFFINSLPSWLALTFPILYKVLPFLKITNTFPSYEAIEKVARELKQYQGWTPLQEEVFRDAVEQKADGTWSSKFVLQARNEIFQDVMQVAGLSKTLDIPSLLILPEKGLNRTAGQIKPYKQYLNNLEIVRVPGNHWAFLGEPEAFNHQIKTFLLPHRSNEIE